MVLQPQSCAAGLLIRAALPEDLPAILELLAQDSMSDTPEASGPTEGHRSAFETMSSSPDHAIVVGTIDHRVVATLQLSFIPGLSHDGRWRAQIEGVRVDKDLRNSGVGTALIHWVIARARERNCWRIELSSNRAREAAQRFYARLGFRASHVGMKLAL
jgi:GNAT superfamily N-acetyltransferase